MGLDVSMFLSFTEAIAWAKARGVVLPDVYYGSKIGIARAESFSVAGLASLDQLELIKQSLDTATAEGIGFADWKKLVTADDINLTLANHRLDNIFRTNIQGAYMAGRWDSIQANKDDRAYLMYDAVNDSRTRPAHKAMDNIIKPVGDVFWKKNYPPNGYRCRCSVISLTEAQAKRRGGVTDDNDIPDEAKADKGWDYNGGEARGEGIKRAVQNKLLSCFESLGFAKRVRNDACSLAQYNDIKMLLMSAYALANRDFEMPKPEIVSASLLLPKSTTHDEAVAKFLAEFDDTDQLVKLTDNITIHMTDDFFVKQSGASKAEGKERIKFMMLFAMAIKNPQEAWLSLDDGSKRVFLTLLSRYQVGNELVEVFGKLELKESGYYRGITIYQPEKKNYIMGERFDHLVRYAEP
jgi:SPP1 gp7 family putative phage head morphogenesis protein